MLRRQLVDAQAEAVQPPNEFYRRSGTANQNTYGCVKLPTRGIFFKGIENGDPNRRNAAGDCHFLVDHQLQDAFGIDMGTREHETRAEHGGGIRNAPGIGVEHGSNRQDGIGLAHAKRFDQATAEGMQHKSAVRVDDALGKTRRTRGETHRGSVVFVNRRVVEVGAGSSQQLFIIQKAFGHGMEAIGHDDHTFERDILAELFIDGIEHVIYEEKAVTRMFGDARNFMRMEAKVQRVQDAAGAWNSEEGFQVAGMIPHHGSDAVPWF